MGVRWDGVDTVFAALDRIDAAGPDGARGSLGLAVEHLATISARLAPLETGALVGSRKVTVDGNRGSVTYGTPYARFQHYRLDLRHEHGQALYLEQPTRTEAGVMISIIADGTFAATRSAV